MFGSIKCVTCKERWCACPTKFNGKTRASAPSVRDSHAHRLRRRLGLGVPCMVFGRPQADMLPLLHLFHRFELCVLVPWFLIQCPQELRKHRVARVRQFRRLLHDSCGGICPLVQGVGEIHSANEVHKRRVHHLLFLEERACCIVARSWAGAFSAGGGRQPMIGSSPATPNCDSAAPAPSEASPRLAACHSRTSSASVATDARAAAVATVDAPLPADSA